MTSAKIRIEQAPAWVARLEGDMRRAAEKGLYSAGLRMVRHIQTVVIPATERDVEGARPPVDRGAYRAAWLLAKLGPREVLVSNSLPYAAVIEEGARAANVKVGRAMIDALAAWVVRKGIVGRKEGPMAARSVAWAIAKKMQKDGIFNKGRGLRVLERAMKSAPQFLREEVERELGRLK